MPDANKEYVVNQVALPLFPSSCILFTLFILSFPAGWGCIWGSRAEVYGLDNSRHGLVSFLFFFLILRSTLELDRDFINNSQSNLMSNIIIILNLCFYYAS